MISPGFAAMSFLSCSRSRGEFHGPPYLLGVREQHGTFADGEVGCCLGRRFPANREINREFRYFNLFGDDCGRE
jgi:hypothetical protein